MPKRNIVWIALAAVIAVLLWQVPKHFVQRDALYNQFSPLLDVRLQILKYYVEKVDEKVLLRGAIDGMLSRLDPYSEYYDAYEHEQFNKRVEGQFPGIGIVLEQRPGGEPIIVSPIEGSPAFLAGLRAGDRIIKIDGTETNDLSLVQSVRMILGKPDTTVTLTINRPSTNETFEKTITRGLVTMRTIRGWARSQDWKWDYLIDPRRHIGYVRISSFERNTPEQLDEAIQELLRQGMRGLVLDVRDNPGGLLPAVVEMANAFLPEGRIVSTRGRSTPEAVRMATPENTYPNFQMAILVNKGSASASEILAGALRDNHRATVVGETTFGKGSVQELIPIENKDGTTGAVKLTTAYYYLPDGERIHGQGVVPDKIVELSAEQRDAMIEAQQTVYSTRHPNATTQATTSTAPAETHLEILIDPQLQAALEIVRQKLTSPPGSSRSEAH